MLTPIQGSRVRRTWLPCALVTLPPPGSRARRANRQRHHCRRDDRSHSVARHRCPSRDLSAGALAEAEGPTATLLMRPQSPTQDAEPLDGHRLEQSRR